MTGRGLLLAELERIARSSCHVLRELHPDDFGFQPTPDLRTALELANQLGQLVILDLKLITGATADELKVLEDELWRESADDWCGHLRHGVEQVQRYMEELTFDAFENGSATAYYGRTQTNAKWLLDIISRLYHHRAQLYFYLRLLDYRITPQILET
jgi:hypothetical protein